LTFPITCDRIFGCIKGVITMFNISYEDFKNLILSYSDFTVSIIENLCFKYGNDIIMLYFEKLCEESLAEFTVVIDVYLQYVLKNDVKFDDSFVGSIDTLITNQVCKYAIMNRQMEYEQGINLKKGRESLIIIKDNKEGLYPSLEMEKIFLSVKDEEDVLLLRKIKRLSISLEDDNIFSKEISLINRYLSLCSFTIPNKEELVKKFPELDFDNKGSLGKEEYIEQLYLLSDYVIAKFNFYHRNLRLVAYAVKGYVHDGFPFSDAYQEGIIGLMKAINMYDVDLGYRFSTYAIWWIKQVVKRALVYNANMIKRRVVLSDKIYRLKNFREEYYISNGVKPTDEVCALSLSMTLEEIRTCDLYLGKVISLNAPLDFESEDSADIMSVVQSSDESVSNKAVNSDLINYLIDLINNNFSERDSFILLNRIGMNDEKREYTLQELADIFGISKMRVNQIVGKGYKKVKSLYKINNINS